MKRIVFMGTPDYAKAILERLIDEDSVDVVGVFTQPDKPVGRKQVITPSSVKVVAQAHEIALFQPKSLKQDSFKETIKALKPDFIIVAAFGQILPQEILDIAVCVNLHASMLPRYRGASPIQEALLHGDTTTGVTAMLMDAKMDTGAIIDTKRIDIAHEDVASTLFDKLTKAACDLTIDVIEHFDKHNVVAQDERHATYCKKISKHDGLVDFNDAQLLFNKYRAYTPWPGVFLESGLKLKSIQLLDTTKSHQAGKILHINKESIDVGCTQGVVRILAVQPVSKKEMAVVDYINGKRLGCDDTLS